MRRILLSFILLCFTSTLFPYTFINSVPSGAEVSIGKTVVGITPLLIKEKNTKKTTLVFRKPGFHSSSLNFKSRGTVTNLYSILTPDTFSLYFPDINSVVINNKSFDNKEIRNIPSGFYHFKTESDAIHMDRVNPNHKYLVFSLIMTGIGLTTGIVAHYTGNNAFSAYTNNSDPDQVFSLLESSKFLDILSWSGYGLAGLGGAFSIYFGVDEILYKKKNQSIEIKSQNQTQDYQVYNLAMDQISQGKSEQAFKNFSKVINKFKDSKFVPVSLLRRATLSQKQKKYQAAINDLLLVRDKYPIYEIYEIAVKYLADNYALNKEYDNAIENYQDIKNIHENYSLNQLDLLIFQTTALKIKDEKSDSSALRKQLESYIQRDALELGLKTKAEVLLEELP